MSQYFLPYLIIISFLINIGFSANNVPYVSSDKNSIKVTLGTEISVTLSVGDEDASDTLELLTDFQPATVRGTSLVPLQSTPNTFVFTWRPETLDTVVLR